MGLGFAALQVDIHFFQQRAEQLLSISVRRGGRLPNTLEIGAQSVNLLRLFIGQAARTFTFPPGQFGLGGSPFTKSLFSPTVGADGISGA